MISLVWLKKTLVWLKKTKASSDFQQSCQALRAGPALPDHFGLPGSSYLEGGRRRAVLAKHTAGYGTQ